MDRSRTPHTKKSEWVATEGSFAALLEWLDHGFPSEGLAYIEVRKRLVTYFDRKGCSDPDELADETLNRVQRRLEEEGSITAESPAKFCYAIAKFVFLEYLRSGRKKEISEEFSDHSPTQTASAVLLGGDEDTERETKLNCLENCLQDLEDDRKELVLRYYQGEQREKIENRRRLAARSGLTMNALSIRAYRIREKLEICVRKCVERAK